MDLLGEERQALWTGLRASLTHKLEYWLGLLYPSQVEEAAREVDKLFREVMERVVGSHLPHQPGLLTCACCTTVEGLEVHIPGLEEHTFQSLILQLPLRHGGLGVRSQLFTSPLAYYGALEQSVPHFSTVCPPLQHLYSEEEGEAHRWAPLLASGCRTGRELGESWRRVKEEVEEMCTYLGEEVPTILACEAEGLGEGRTDGSSRAIMVREVERLRAASLDKAMVQLPNTRAALVRANTDKLSTSFLLARPGPHTSIPSTYFAERLLVLLAVPSVLCRGVVGERVGRQRVCKWGDAILNATLKGPHNKTCHDMIKSTLNSLYKYCGLSSEVEPYRVFGDLVPQLPLNRVQARQARDPLTPDIRVDLPDGAGTIARTYIEIKTCSGTSQWYRNPREKAVERRVKDIHTSYTRHAREADIKYHGVEHGPISQRLANMAFEGMAFGMMGEASKTCHSTIQVMAEARVAMQNRAWGRGEEEEKAFLSTEVSYLRRRISSANVIAFGQRLAGRMGQVGGQAAGQATGRREHWGREEEMARREREAAWLERTSSRDIVRRGQLWLR